MIASRGARRKRPAPSSGCSPGPSITKRRPPCSAKPNASSAAAPEDALLPGGASHRDGGGTGVAPPAAAPPCEASGAEIRECIRQLVSVVRRKSTGNLQVDAHRLASLKTLVKLLSMDNDELLALPDDQRAQVMGIRNGALQKMRMARGPSAPVRQSSCQQHSGTRNAAAQDARVWIARMAACANEEQCMRLADEYEQLVRSPPSMPPPAFYTRKTYFGVPCSVHNAPPSR
jgi:hypothetical protein